MRWEDSRTRISAKYLRSAFVLCLSLAQEFIYCRVLNFNYYHQTCRTTITHRMGHSRGTQISNPFASQSPPVCEDICPQFQKRRTDQLSTFTPQEMGIWPMNRTQNGPES